MDRNSQLSTQLERQVSRALAGTAQFKAPQSLEARVLTGIEQRTKVPWWRRRVPEWPYLAQIGFALAGAVAAAVMVLARPAAAVRLDAVMHRPTAVLQQPVADLHVTMDMLAVLHRLTDTLVGSLPDDVWYGGMALCAAAYAALFFLIVLGYRLLQAPLASR